MSDITTARAHASADYEGIVASARVARMAAMTLPDDYRMVLVDGSQFSPSWRALRGGAAVWEMSETNQDLCEIYTEKLDRLTDEYEGASGEFLTWEDGALFLCGPEYQGE